MTAEVSIMNKHGMSMAADSAITSGFDGVPKVYNSANKLFPLSKEHPIGFMVYGSASFMEIPWEVIIKSYRDYLGNKRFNNVQDYFDDFMDFLRQDMRFKNEELEDIIVYRTFSDLLKQMIRRVETEMEEEGDEASGEQKARKLLEEEVDQQTKDFLTEEAILDLSLIHI